MLNIFNCTNIRILFTTFAFRKKTTKKMLRFISFGSGSSGNSYYLFTEKDGLLIDAGVGIRSLKKYFREYGFRTDNLSGILITHDHADHVKAVGKFSAEYGINVYATEEVHKGIVRNYCVTKKFRITKGCK